VIVSKNRFGSLGRRQRYEPKVEIIQYVHLNVLVKVDLLIQNFNLSVFKKKDVEIYKCICFMFHTKKI
jgi:hypothetical protein